MSAAIPQVVGTLRLMVFIDGAHVRENLKDNFSDDVLDYNAFLQSILTQLTIPYFFFDVVRVYYYDATPELDDPRDYVRKLYIQGIRDVPGFEDRLGALKKTKKKELRQKRVDTLVAVDMLSKAYENHYDIAILISGDEDYLPVVDAVKDTGKRVYGVFFESHGSANLKESFDRGLVINGSWITGEGLKGKADILNFHIPDRFKSEENVEICIKFKESLPKGYAELVVIGNGGQIYNDTYCFLASRAIKHTDDRVGEREREIVMGMTIPRSAQAGDYKAIVVIYGVEPKMWYAYNEKAVILE